MSSRSVLYIKHQLRHITAATGTGSATTTTTPVTPTLTRTTANAVATLTPKQYIRSRSITVTTFNFYSHSSSCTYDYYEWTIVPTLLDCRSTEDGNGVKADRTLHVVRMRMCPPPIYIRPALCGEIHTSISPINTINWRTRMIFTPFV